jgi:Uncharacterized protein conserved in bacteria, prophage-related
MDMNISSLIKMAVNIAGSQSELARQVGVTPQAVHAWLEGGPIHPHSALRVERATNGAVRREELRPDIFGPLDTESIPERVQKGCQLPITPLSPRFQTPEKEFINE